MINDMDAFGDWRPAGFDGVFEWDFLLPAFGGTKISPMDFDCVVERRRRFLIFETKHPGKKLPMGQAITLRTALQEMRGRCTLILIAAKVPDMITCFDVCWVSSGEIREREVRGDKDDLVCFVSCWFSAASAGTDFNPLSVLRERDTNGD